MIELLRKRRSIREYLDKKIESEKLDTLKEAGLRSPSSRNLQPWTFFFIDNPELLKKISTAKPHGSEFLARAALGVVIAGDENKSDVWVEDCSIAAIILQLTAESLGLGSCWIQIRKRMRTDDETAESYIKDLLGLENHMQVECIIAIGYPAETKPAVPGDQLRKEKIRRFPNG